MKPILKLTKREATILNVEHHVYCRMNRKVTADVHAVADDKAKPAGPEPGASVAAMELDTKNERERR